MQSNNGITEFFEIHVHVNAFECLNNRKEWSDQLASGRNRLAM